MWEHSPLESFLKHTFLDPVLDRLTRNNVAVVRGCEPQKSVTSSLGDVAAQVLGPQALEFLEGPPGPPHEGIEELRGHQLPAGGCTSLPAYSQLSMALWMSWRPFSWCVTPSTEHLLC